MSIVHPPVELPLRERAATAWRAQQSETERRQRDWLAALRQEYRENLHYSIESTLGVACDLARVECPLSDEDLQRGVPDGGLYARTRMDGLTLALIRRGNARVLALEWECPVCGCSPSTDMRLGSLEALGELLEYLPTLCRCGGR